jgi:uncharacterized protein
MRTFDLIPVVFLALSIVVGACGCGQRAVGSLTLDQQLIVAAKKGDDASIQKLLKKGARIEARSKDGLTALALAADFGHADTVELLLRHGADATAGGLTGKEALLETAKAGNPGKMRVLLGRGAFDLATKNEVLLATVQSTPPLVIETQASPEEMKQIERWGKEHPVEAMPFPAMDYAQTVKVLLDSGASIEEKDETGATPLIWAAGNAQTDTVKLLLERGASVDATSSSGMTALIGAACSCAVIDMPYTIDGIKLLLDRGANVEAKEKGGTTALMSAAGWGRTEIIELLLDHGARVNDRDSHGNTALLIAASGIAVPTASTVKLLLERGADVDARDDQGNTALLLTAAEGGFEGTKIAELLLSHGANLHATNKHGNTALELAEKNGRTEIAALIRKALEKSHDRTVAGALRNQGKK